MYFIRNINNSRYQFCRFCLRQSMRNVYADGGKEMCWAFFEICDIIIKHTSNNYGDAVIDPRVFDDRSL